MTGLLKSGGAIPHTGPLAVMLNAPEMLARGEHLRAYLRGDGSGLPANIIELAMLVTARENDCQFIWNAHAAAGRRAGLNDALVDNLRDKKPLTGLSDQEAAVADYGREYFTTRRVSQPTFDRGFGPVRGPGVGRVNHSDGVLCHAGVQHQRL